MNEGGIGNKRYRRQDIKYGIMKAGYKIQK